MSASNEEVPGSNPRIYYGESNRKKGCTNTTLCLYEVHDIHPKTKKKANNNTNLYKSTAYIPAWSGVP